MPQKWSQASFSVWIMGAGVINPAGWHPNLAVSKRSKNECHRQSPRPGILFIRGVPQIGDLCFPPAHCFPRRPLSPLSRQSFWAQPNGQRSLWRDRTGPCAANCFAGTHESGPVMSTPVVPRNRGTPPLRHGQGAQPSHIRVGYPLTYTRIWRAVIGPLRRAVTALLQHAKSGRLFYKLTALCGPDAPTAVKYEPLPWKKPILRPCEKQVSSIVRQSRAAMCLVREFYTGLCEWNSATEELLSLIQV